jgi:hypothetical protein
MPSKIDVYKEGQRRQQKRQRCGLLVFCQKPGLPTAGSQWTNPVLSGVAIRGRSYWFIRASAGNNKDNAAACLCFVNNLAFLRPAADELIQFFLGLQSEVAHKGLSGLVRLLEKREEG